MKHTQEVTSEGTHVKSSEVTALQ